MNHFLSYFNICTYKEYTIDMYLYDEFDEQRTRNLVCANSTVYNELKNIEEDK